MRKDPDLIAAIKRFKGAFDKHQITKLSERYWQWAKPDTRNYACWIAIMDEGTIVVTGDLGNIMFQFWSPALGVFNSAEPGRHSYSYMYEKVPEEMRQHFVQPRTRLLKEWLEKEIKEAEANEDTERTGLLTQMKNEYDDGNFNSDYGEELDVREVYSYMSDNGIEDSDYPRFEDYTERFYLLVEAIRTFVRALPDKE